MHHVKKYLIQQRQSSRIFIKEEIIIDKINILIVDDVQANIYSLRELLQKDDIRIFEANSGEECLKMLLLERIDIILLDVQMPNMDGFETAQYIRQNQKLISIPIIFVTATNRTEDFNLKGYVHGAIDIIYKPIQKDILNAKISVLIEMSKIKNQLKQQVKLLTVLNEENQKMRKEVEKIASHDYLTNLINRRKLDEEYELHYRDAIRNKKPISLLMIDLDNFKGYNDYFGHTKGDEALQNIASVLKESIRRPLDKVGRYGGEEFLVILPNTDLKGAINIAKKIIQDVRNEKILHCPICVFKYLTVSIGVSSEVPVNIDSMNELLEHSDQALYKAKHGGKNQYQIYIKESSSS